MQKDSFLAPVLLIGAMLLCCGGHVLAALGGFGVFAGLATGEYALVIGGVMIAAIGIGLFLRARRRSACPTPSQQKQREKFDVAQTASSAKTLSQGRCCGL